MSLKQYVADRLNKILVATGGVGLIIGAAAGYSLLPAIQVQNKDGITTFSIRTDGSQSLSGSLLAGSGSWKFLVDTVNQKVGIGTTSPDSTLEVIGTVSGTTIFANTSLRSSGSLTFEGAGSGISLTLSGLRNCNTIDTNAVGLLACGTDDGTTYAAGRGLGITSTSFSLNATITGSLVRFTTLSGSSVFAKTTLSSSGSLKVLGIMSGRLLSVDGNATITGSLLVKGGIGSRGALSGAALTINGASTFFGNGVPGADDKYDLGANSIRWRHAYLSGSLNIGTLNNSGSISYQTNGIEGLTLYGKASGTPSMFISSGGLIAVGKTSLPKASFEVLGTMSGRGLSTAGGNMTVSDNGAMVVNEQGIDVDTRIESDGNANMFFVDGGQNRIGIGTNAPNVIMDIRGGATNAGLQLFASGDGSNYNQIEMWADVASDKSWQLVHRAGNPAPDRGALILYANQGAGYIEMIKFNGGPGLGTGAIFNNSGNANYDFRMASDNNSHTFFMDSSVDRIGINNSAPKAVLDVVGRMSGSHLTLSALSPIGANANALCLTGTGAVRVNIATTCLLSSKRFKHDINPLDDGIGIISQLQPVSYRDNGSNELNVGLIAEEVEKIDPRLVFYESDGTTVRGVKYENAVAVLVKAIQELEDRIKTLEEDDFCEDVLPHLSNYNSIQVK